MERRCFPCRVKLYGRVWFVTWISDVRDGFLRDSAGRLIAAASLEMLAAAAGDRGETLEPDAPAEYDFDRLRAWCAAPDPRTVDCPVFLNAWNFFDDFAELHAGAGTPYNRWSRAGGRAYDKLFWGCNLPSVTPAGKRFDPVWRREELAAIRLVLVAGCTLLRLALDQAAAGEGR